MQSNMVSVSWGDHLEFGEGDGALDTTGTIERSVARWREDLDAGVVLWREGRSNRKYARKFHSPGVSRRSISPRFDPEMDEHRTVIETAHANGMKALLYVTIIDEGWPLELGWRGGFETWQSYFILRHPDHQQVDRSGEEVHHGVLSYAYPEVRRYKLGIIRWLLEGYDWDGVFICTRSQSKPARHADQFEFNEPVVREYQRRHGVDIREKDFDLDLWRRLRGEYFTQYFREVKAVLDERGLELAVGIPRSTYLGPPIGNLYLDWQTWLREGIVDRLVIDQVASICPSTWTWLWSDDQGYGYVENYLTGKGIAPLEEDLDRNWKPVVDQSSSKLYLARMWSPFDSADEARLSALPGVSGLVFSSFHHDNPQVLERDLWAM